MPTKRAKQGEKKVAGRKTTSKRTAMKAASARTPRASARAEGGGVPASEVGEIVQSYVDDGAAQVTVTERDDGTYDISRRF